MSFHAVRLQHEELPWSWPLHGGGTVATQRQRLIIRVQDNHKRLHEAELAPCPGVHPESLQEALQQWHEIENLWMQGWDPARWNWTRPAFGLWDPPACLHRSVLTAVEQLLLSWMQRENPAEISLPAPVALEGSALMVLQQDAEASFQEFMQLWAKGFQLIKCKLGRHAPEQEFKILQRMSAYAGGSLRLRLDANRGMGSEARAFWKRQSHHLPILYWEEAAGMEPLALDETLWDSNDLPPAGAWILKPSRLGLSRTVELLRKAAVLNIPCVLSNAFDSGLGLRCFAWIYAAFCASPQPLGYGTTRFLPDDLWQSASWGKAQVTIPMQPFAAMGGS